MESILERLEAMYETLKLEARIELHLEPLENAYRLLRARVAAESSVGSIWYNTYELLDETIAKLRAVKALLQKYRLTGLPLYLADALRLANELVIRAESRPAIPSQKDSVRVAASEVAFRVSEILKKVGAEGRLARAAKPVS